MCEADLIATLDAIQKRILLQAYPSRTKDPDQVDFSTGFVELDTGSIWGAVFEPFPFGNIFF